MPVPITGAFIVVTGAAMVVIGNCAEMEPTMGIGAAIVVVGIADAINGADMMGAGANVSTMAGADAIVSITTGAGACTIFSTVWA